MQTDLHTSKIMVALGVTLFTVTFGAAPLVLAPISEVYGRWGVYIISMVLFTLLFIPAALTKTIGGMLVTRFVSGIFGSTGISVTGGTLSDLWSSTERGLPMAIFSFGAFAATGLGPVIFGIVEQKYGFRIVFWMMFAGSGAFTALICILMRETRASVLLSRKAARLRKETGSDRYRSQSDLERKSIKLMVRTSLVRPIHMLVTEPVLIAFTLWFSFAWASLNGALQQQVLTVCFQIIMYILLQSVSLVFGGIYGFDISESGYLFVAQPIAAAFGLVINHWTNKLYLKRVAKRGPEARLYMAMCAGIIMPTGAWIYAWTARASVHWIVPTIGTVLIYTGMFGIFLTCFSYIADSYTVYAASALSATNFARNLIAAFAPLYAADLYNRLGLAGGGSLLAGLSA
ncbi:hypothetical protein MNV49_003712 [Pseudohyphozyma bogoriensis]|nr:hypothetical protein MNV49_003712 [Pseudohyphozyma bogoriensis]